jgi:hypothetical protein
MYTYTMPNKTIYISQDDLPYYEEAKRLAGKSISSVIAEALKAYILDAKKKESAMKEVKLPVGPRGMQRSERFIGTKAFDWSGRDSSDEWWMKVEAYVTQERRIAVYATLWKQERFSHLKPEATALYVDDFDGSDFKNLISPDFGDKLVAFKDAYDTHDKSLLM